MLILRRAEHMDSQTISLIFVRILLYIYYDGTWSLKSDKVSWFPDYSSY